MTIPVAADRRGRVERDGVSVAWYSWGDGPGCVLLMPTWSISDSRVWKHQVADLHRRYRVLAFDGRGSGASDRPAGAEHYTDDRFVADAVAVMDAAGVERAVVVGLSAGGHWAPLLAGRHPERVLGLFLFAPATTLSAAYRHRLPHRFDAELEDHPGWAKFNARYWHADFAGFRRFFFAECFPEPHSSKAIEEGVEWAAGTTPAVLVDTVLGGARRHPETESVYRSVHCPVRVVHGEDDTVVPPEAGRLTAELTGGDFTLLAGVGHCAPVRHPVLTDRLLTPFLDSLLPRREAGRGEGSAGEPRRLPVPGARRPRRALVLSSPIGLGHGRRDLAVVRELRRRRPDLEVDWLAQHPVTALLEAAGEPVHPASGELLSESRHWERRAGEHRLHAFRAYRDMHAVLSANFLVFQRLVEAERYDLVLADEAWEVDHYWHEHPELKRAALAWMTDFVGFLPMASGGDEEARLVADANAEMLEHVDRYPRVRDLALFAGDAADLPDVPFGPGLPGIRSWTTERFETVGAIAGYDAAALPPRRELRRELGWGDDEPVCVVAVGGSGVGEPLLRRAVAAFPEARRRVPGLRMVAVAGPRIDPAGLATEAGLEPGLEIRGYVDRLHRLLAACDLALVQGGLATCLELAAAGTPFLYVPIEDHFEQQHHVRPRLRRLGVGRAVEYRQTAAQELAASLADAILEARRNDRPPAPPFDAGGAERAAERIAALL